MIRANFFPCGKQEEPRTECSSKEGCENMSTLTHSNCCIRKYSLSFKSKGHQSLKLSLGNSRSHGMGCEHEHELSRESKARNEGRALMVVLNLEKGAAKH
uniref:Uncharacterized protein n=1 Tax=Salix viminalis TaxID=40686 RepID=A0A6N2MMH7_SALVM